MAKNNGLVFYTDCVGCPPNEVEDLINMIDTARDISRQSFMRHVSAEQLHELFPTYARRSSQGLTLKKDWAVRYATGRFRNQKVYFIIHSGIEYIFGPVEASA